ncbi:MAG: monofunctional biosynthetic peptidoglycan transglycosylase [Thermoanaerobaculia bacterium]|jgi:monofunctional biosynthetic peptidoglycan transglycosylase
MTSIATPPDSPLERGTPEAPAAERSGWWRNVKRLVIWSSAALALFVVYEWATFPDVARLRKENPATSAFMEQRRAQLRSDGKSDELKRTWVSYERISPNLRRAVIVSEDSAFYEHEGVDVEELKKSFETNLEKGKLARGGSTITQQLAKNLYLSPSKNPWRKVKELLITRALERELTKKRILEIYLNVVEFGERVYGAEAASRYYFGKPASALGPSEAALLAGCLPNPRKMNPGAPNRRLRSRQRIILSRMSRWGRYFEQQVLTAPPPEHAAAEEPTTGTPPPEGEPPPDLTDTTATATTTEEPLPAEPPTEPSTDTSATEPPPPTGS